MDADQKRIEELKTLIKDAVYDMQVRRIHVNEFRKSTLHLIEELKELEEKSERKEKSWPKFMEQFSKIVEKETKPELPEGEKTDTEVV